MQSLSRKQQTDVNRPNYNKYILPSASIAYGAASFMVHNIRDVDFITRNQILHEKPRKTNLDNFTQYFPAALAIGINLTGYQGMHDPRRSILLYGATQFIAAAIVVPTKRIIRSERPDGSNRLSFPSGHAATAFSSAHFLFREYRSKNFWLSISGYPFAFFTGIYRLVNNKHWVSDVVAGAGVGIFSTEIAYWIYPKMEKMFFSKNKKRRSAVFPTVGKNYIGFSALGNF
ncbi:phosphatase PAP2 family protein [Sphingobacterium siyangense]|uniref:phosphatase PAP2 family protein n=1 Tax=Sphingobacterium siyangense TaxID=459529 RepID=UPI003DA3A92E